MKILRLIFIFCLVTILFSQLISGASIELNSEYDKGETMVIKVSGGFVDNIKKENIFFYRGYMPTFMADYDVIEIQNMFFIYVKPGLEKIPGNYSIHIKDVRYTQGSQTISDDIIGNFSISNVSADFWVYPGAKIVTEDYSLQVQNLQSETILIDVSYNSGLENSEGGLFSGLFGSSGGDYSVEVFSGEIKDIDFEFIYNTSLDEIHLSSANTEYFIPIYNVYEEVYYEEIIIDNETGEEIIIIEEIIEEEVIINEETGEVITQEEMGLTPCAELGGTICLKDVEICQGTSDYASDDLCCFGYCEEESKSGFGQYAGWILLVVVALVVGWIILKKKGKKPKPANLVKIGSKR